jgi:hypothetical protein
VQLDPKFDADQVSVGVGLTFAEPEAGLARETVVGVDMTQAVKVSTAESRQETALHDVTFQKYVPALVIVPTAVVVDSDADISGVCGLFVEPMKT